jgi:hypothetical protein
LRVRRPAPLHPPPRTSTGLPSAAE